MFACLSAKISVIPAPRTGRVVISRKETTRMAQDIKQKLRALIPVFLASWSETTNVIAPNSEDNPSTCKKITAKETAGEDEKSIPVSG